MNPVAFQIGPFAVHWYGILIVGGALLAAYIATIEAKRRGENPEHAWDALALCLLFGIIGARLYHVFSIPEGCTPEASYPCGWYWYRQHPMDAIAFWHGGYRGLGIYGAVAGGVLAVFVYTRYAKLSFLRWLDIGAPGLILCQAIARWANYINQELYGPPTDLPWGIYIPPTHRLPGLEAYERFHPVFFYESMWNLLGFIVLMYVGRRFASRLLDGDIFFLYAIWYPFGRFFLEFLRPDAWKIGSIATAQIIALASIVISLALIIYRHRRARSAPQPVADEESGEAAEAP
jgi:phosphatidylglycerol:prolipoprotein diacylglycerol transferase